jgi:hypothetical protein
LPRRPGGDTSGLWTRGATTGEVAWAARVFLVLGDDGLIHQDYHLTVKPIDPA